MAIKTATAVPEGPELVMLPLEQLVPHLDNVRRDLGDLTDLTKSIEGSGILEPLVVLPVHPDGDGTQLIVAGHRRYAAAVKAKGITHAPCIIRDLNPVQVIEAMLVENLQRSDITTIEEARGYARLVEMNTKVADIARKVGRSQQLVKDRLALLQLPEKILAQVETGDLSLTKAAEIIPHATDDDAMAWIAKKLPLDTWSKPATMLATYIRNRNRERVITAEAEKIRAAGLTVFTPPNNYWMPPATVRPDRSCKVTQLGLATANARKHKSEPCHAVLIETIETPGVEPGWKAERTTICTQPGNHMAAVREVDEPSALQVPAEKLAEEPIVEDPEAIARDEAREQAAEAKAARRVFIKAHLAATPHPVLHPVIEQWLIQTGDEWDALLVAAAELLDVDPERVEDEQDWETSTRLLVRLMTGDRAEWHRWATALPFAVGEAQQNTYDESLFTTHLRHLVALGYEPTPWDAEYLAQADANDAAAKLPDVDAMELDLDTIATLLVIHDACVADPEMGHPGEDLDDTAVEDASLRGLIEIDNQVDGPRITLTELGSGVATVLAARAAEADAAAA